MYTAENGHYADGTFSIHGYQIAWTEDGLRIGKTPIQKARDAAAEALNSLKREAIAAVPQLSDQPDGSTVIKPKQSKQPEITEKSAVQSHIEDMAKGPDLSKYEPWELPPVRVPDPTISVSDLKKLLGPD